MIWQYILIFIISALALFYSSSRIVAILMAMAKYLGLREFVLGFFIMAFASSLPNLMIGLNSAFQKIPQLSFGDIIGGNVVDLTLVLALAVFFSRNAVPAHSKMVQKSAIFCAVIAVLPIILIYDGVLSREDGMILILSFFVYALWLFAKKERFSKEYKITGKEKKSLNVFTFFTSVFKFVFFLIILFLATEGIIFSVKEFSVLLSVSIPVIGLLVVGLANSMPEAYFSIISARRGQNWMILGNLMGSVIVCATLILGIVALIYPIKIDNFSVFALARVFLIIAAILFYIFVKTGQKITKLEALFLLLVYFLFLASEIKLIDFSGFFV